MAANHSRRGFASVAAAHRSVDYWLGWWVIIGSIPIGVVAWDDDQPRNEIDVPSASHLRIEAHPQPRVFTLVWTITP